MVSLSGTNLQQSINSGYLTANTQIDNILSINQFKICINQTQQIGQLSIAQITIQGTIYNRCDICQSGTVSYGICVDDLQFAQLKNGTLQCVYPFEYVNDQCQCAYGFMLNISVCIDLIKEIDKRSVSSNNSQSQRITQIQQNISNIITNQNIININIDSNIQKNASIINQNNQLNNNQLSQNLMNNNSVTNNQITIINNNVNNNNSIQTTIIKQIQDQLIILKSKSNCISNNGSNSSTNNTPTQNDTQLNDTTKTIYSNITISDTQIQDTLVACNQPVYISTFDVATITNSLSGPDFASGYAFATSNVITNAFVDVQDNTYAATVTQLFQSQSTFTNIKLQIGTQVIGSGSLISAGTTLTINQVNIISKLGSNITVNSTYKFNILIAKASNSILNNLLLNMTFAPSQGSIALIGSVAGSLNITNYQVLGFYVSQANIALGANSVNASNIYVDNVSFTPYVFNAGNMSSYLFSAVNSSSVLLDDISIVLGTVENPMLSNFLATTSANYYQFGGLVSNLNSTTLNITDIQYNVKQTYMIFYISNSGLLLGRASLAGNAVIIQRVCLSHVIKSYTSFNTFGVIGQFEGTLQFQQSNIMISIQSSDIFSYVGMIGSATTVCVYTNIQNVKSSVSVNENAGNYVSALIAAHTSSNCTIQNSTVQNSYLSSTQFTGGFIGYCQSLVVIQFSSVVNSVIRSGTYSGGIIGYAYSNIQISNTTVQNSTMGYNSQASSFIGALQAGSFFAISNDQAINVTVSGNVHIGGIIGYAEYNSFIIISEGSVQNSTFSASSSNAGAYLGTFSSNYQGGTMKIVKSNINKVNVTTPSSFGMIVGYRYPAYSVSTSMPYGDNFVNGVKQPNCVNFASTCDASTNNSASDIYTNITTNDTQIQDTLVACNQPVYISTFDVATITNSLSGPDFASGYAFATSNVITNAFVDVQDNTYAATVTQLFQSQSTFTNIKLQIGTQVIGSGSLISAGTTLTINQVNIISKLGSNITVNSTYKFNILIAKASNSILNNLLLNMTFAPSQGSIALIGSVAGSLNITNYQVLGFYVSQANIALGANSVNASNIYVDNVSFTPYVFNAGNMSSYLFSAVNSSSVLLDDISIVLGTVENPMLFHFWPPLPLTTTSLEALFNLN
ncbi:type_II secretion system protein [Hexamita inflata]|uniref:Type II secretion system protein n=1 Tax=Hexamita inflata TaxID=28002 RepID=A0AA86N549_9EUKA|nr:type II secretion system protein [Hexamita inflata]